MPLNHLGCITISGPDANTFLQGQVTCDMNLVSASQASPGAVCDHKGRMLANFWIYLMPNESMKYQLILSHSLVAPLLEHLQKYAAFSKATLEDASSDYSINCYTGPNVAEELARCVDYQNPIATDTLHSVFNGAQTTFINIPGELKRYLAVLRKKDIIEHQEHHNSTTINCTEEQWQSDNIEAGVVLLETKTSGLFTPQMINLQLLGGVSFKKGCYVGQEVVARTEYLGKLKRHLYRARVKNTAAVGDDITDEKDQTLGVVTSVAIDDGHTDLLCVLQDRGANEHLHIKNNTIIDIKQVS